MTPALSLTITQAGLARFTEAQIAGDLNLSIASVGLTDTEFLPAPTLTALPGEFRRIASISGEAVGDNIIHMVIRDDEDVGYKAKGFGLFFEDGTLFGVYGQPGLLFEKSPLTTFMSAIDIAFPAGDITSLIFGDANFLNPPATTTRQGVVRLATPPEADAGTEPRAAITPALLRRALPIGIIIMWFGAAAAVPDGWAICNGQQVARSDGAGAITTPDLRDRVVVGAGTHPAGATFGAAEKTSPTKPAGEHRPAGSLPAHSHHFAGAGTAAGAPSNVALNTTKRGDTAQGGTGDGLVTAALTDPGHGHAVQVEGNTDPTAPLALEMQLVPSHAHEVTIDVTQPSYALHFIMKV